MRVGYARVGVYPPHHEGGALVRGLAQQELRRVPVRLEREMEKRGGKGQERRGTAADGEDSSDPIFSSTTFIVCSRLV